MIRRENDRLTWQSKAILLLIVPWTAMHVILQSHWWFTQVPVVAYTTLGISGIFGLIVWKMRAGTLGAAATGGAITASLMFSTTEVPYNMSWLHGGLMPLLAVFLLTFAATKAGRAKKEQQGTAESRRGRNAAQVAANLGAAALLALIGSIYGLELYNPEFKAILVLAALSEAAADTISSEIGQAFGGQPRMLTTFKVVEPGTDGAITLTGTLAGFFASILIAGIGAFCFFSGPLCPPRISGCDVVGPSLANLLMLTAICALGGMFGLIFDSLLGASWERKGWLNNDAVNFLSTLAAPAFALGLAALMESLGAH